jgi:hypothetical protein
MGLKPCFSAAQAHTGGGTHGGGAIRLILPARPVCPLLTRLLGLAVLRGAGLHGGFDGDGNLALFALAGPSSTGASAPPALGAVRRLPILGFAPWERAEYQSRGSCHVHTLWRHARQLLLPELELKLILSHMTQKPPP